MSNLNIARSLELFFVDGRADGLLTAEVFNWTGHIISSPRTQLSVALTRPESAFTGVYILLGDQAGEPRAYVGEGESIAARIKSHDTNKDWWDRAVLITTTGDGLNKAHVRYLEARLIQIANTVGAVAVENGNSPTLPGLNEAAQSNMESFLEYLLIVLPAIRVDAFVESTRQTILTVGPEKQTIFELVLKKENIRAKATLDGSDFIVQMGSEARKEWIGDRTNKTSYWKLHDDLVKNGILELQDDKRIFTVNYAFSSTSAAGAVVNGRSTAGPTAWKLIDSGKTYREWEEDKLADLSG